MAELTPYKLPRSQMRMDLLRAISEPRMTPQDLAIQEDQRRVKEYGVYRKPTQMENVFKGIEKVTGIQPFGDQPKLDRAMMAGQLATDLVNPGAMLGGKALMPAVAPLITAPGRWFKSSHIPSHNEKLFDTSLTADQRFTRGNRPMRNVHDIGPHLGRESESAETFLDWHPLGDVGPKGSTVQARILGKSVRVPTIGNDYEQIGRFIANDVFEDDKIFKRWMQQNPRSQYHMDTSFSADLKLRKAWRQLSKSTPKKDRGGYVEGGVLHPKDYLEKELAHIPDIPLNNNQRKLRRDFLKANYVEDFGSYLRKAGLTDSQWEDLVQGPFPGTYGREVTERFLQNMKEKGITNIKYENTSRFETGPNLLGNPSSGFSYNMPEVKNKTSTMVLDVDALEPSYTKATGKEMLNRVKDWMKGK
tara:strand:- start:45 stop:1295 length:1251 start_codon:yes stop_codon:yes gene_type:complete